MKCKIETQLGVYEYDSVKLFYGRKVIDQVVAKENLLDFKKLLDLEGIDFGIIYGTLLGAVRDKKFIDYDEDVDVFVLDENREKFLALLFKLREIGFEVARYEGDLLSIMRDNDYIDVYIFRKNMFGKRICNGDSLCADFFERLETITFLGEKFYTPNNKIKFLEKAYGTDWMVPKRNSPAEVKGKWMKLKLLFFTTTQRLIKRSK